MINPIDLTGYLTSNATISTTNTPRTGTVQYNEISIEHMVNLHNSTLDPAPSLSSCYVYILRMFLFSLILPFMQKKSNTGPFYRTREERSLTTRPHTRVEQHSFRRHTTVIMQTVDVALTSQSRLLASQLKNLTCTSRPSSTQSGLVSRLHE